MSTGSLIIATPTRSLRSYIRHYVIIPKGEPAGGGVFLPYCGAIASLFSEAPVIVNGTETRAVRPSNPTLFGPIGEPFVYRRQSPQRSRDVSVVFTALGSALLCGPVMEELESNTVDLDCFLDTASLRELTERLHEVRETARVVELLNRFFVSYFPVHVEKSEAFLPVALSLLESTMLPSVMPRYAVDALQERVHCSARQLQRVMLRTTGLSPKRYLSILRINHVVDRMRRAPHTPFSHIASAFGYTDQAHFVRDFERHTFSKPSVFFKSDEHRELRTFMDFE
jgi:AraC-like DNA-binding protein